ncbi:hypothetical protein ASPBRDRAFT_47954 [Aspergillus brasiliensis CBS 101740]|uniref:Uncharacterized protein n=1 Tax=Aspergillus brasiliensis (strain CBS 101740 / IMI 381727 / IBT 21946) TaxID=767769 RepID=A0A1L9U6V7_ASPBC|nr:hypothetical protein ASPBRDRAFT_47954 [Aspergillus brasiliensis CBS 101740]
MDADISRPSFLKRCGTGTLINVDDKGQAARILVSSAILLNAVSHFIKDFVVPAYAKLFAIKFQTFGMGRAF